MLKSLISKHQDKIVYLFLGVLTTLVDYILFYYLYKWSAIPSVVRGTVSNALAWIGAVLFAYITNKPFVFKSKDWSVKKVAPEFGKFLSCRLASLVFSLLIIFVFVDLLSFNNMLIKILTSIFVVIFNYYASKMFVFLNNNT